MIEKTRDMVLETYTKANGYQYDSEVKRLLQLSRLFMEIQIL